MNSSTGNRRRAALVVDTLLQHGVAHFAIAPGARSAPLATEAFLRVPEQCTVHFDERGLGFAALGHSKASGRPVACIVTSGTAVANLLPAAIEASYSGVPLVLLTADRPANLRDVAANQTILQSGIFGCHVRYAADFPLPAGAPDPSVADWLLDALRHACGETPGPIHLNLPFDEPLLPSENPTPPGMITPTPEAPAPRKSPVQFRIPPATRGVLFVGELSAAEQKRAGILQMLAAKLGFPLFADPLSGLKGHAPPVVHHADLLLELSNPSPPDLVLHFGGRLVSKNLTAWISSLPASQYFQFRRFPERLDPNLQSPQRFSGCPIEWAEQILADLPTPENNTKWSAEWKQADKTLGEQLVKILAASPTATEPFAVCAAAELAAARDAALFLGNSMPIRDFDRFYRARPIRGGVFANRGASGIDGNIATVAGIARGAGSPVVAVLGDLAALHDINSLALLKDLPVTLFLINNHGGGIFRFLPLHLPHENTRRVLEAPHSFDFRQAAAAFGLPYRLLENPAEFRSEKFPPASGPEVLEVPSEIAQNHELHTKIKASLHKSCIFGTI